MFPTQIHYYLGKHTRAVSWALQITGMVG